MKISTELEVLHPNVPAFIRCRDALLGTEVTVPVEKLSADEVERYISMWAEAFRGKIRAIRRRNDMCSGSADAGRRGDSQSCLDA